jgi:hypothetical protein
MFDTKVVIISEIYEDDDASMARLVTRTNLFMEGKMIKSVVFERGEIMNMIVVYEQPIPAKN